MSAPHFDSICALRDRRTAVIVDVIVGFMSSPADAAIVDAVGALRKPLTRHCIPNAAAIWSSSPRRTASVLQVSR